MMSENLKSGTTTGVLDGITFGCFLAFWTNCPAFLLY